MQQHHNDRLKSRRTHGGMSDFIWNVKHCSTALTLLNIKTLFSTPVYCRKDRKHRRRVGGTQTENKNLSSWASTHIHVTQHYRRGFHYQQPYQPSETLSQSCPPPCRKLLNWLLPLSLPLCTLTISCMALYELSAALNAPNSHCSPEISVSPSGDIFALWNSVYFPSLGLFCRRRWTLRAAEHLAADFYF